MPDGKVPKDMLKAALVAIHMTADALAVDEAVSSGEVHKMVMLTSLAAKRALRRVEEQ